MLSKNSADALLEEKVSIIFLSNRNSFELSLWILSLTLSDEPILGNTVVCFRPPDRWQSWTSGRRSASTWNPSSSRCRATPPSRWPASSSSQTAPTIPPSSRDGVEGFHDSVFFQVNVSQRGVGNEGGPGYHYPPKTSCIPLWGRWLANHSFSDVETLPFFKIKITNCK